MRKKFVQLVAGGISLTCILSSIPNQVFATAISEQTQVVVNVEQGIIREEELEQEQGESEEKEESQEKENQEEVKDEVQEEQEEVKVENPGEDINGEQTPVEEVPIETLPAEELPQEVAPAIGGIERLEEPIVLASTLKQDFIKRLYETCLNRTPIDTEINYWVGKIENGEATGASLADFFVNSNELKQQNLSNVAYIKVLYTAFFNRVAEDNGLEYWINQIGSGMSRKDILKIFVDSQEYTDVCEAYGIQKGSLADPDDELEGYTPIQKFVHRFYTKCMGRTPDASGLNYWAQGLINKQFTGQEIAESFVNSNEFTNKNLSDSDYIDVMYSVFFDRAADQGGKNYWLGLLNPWNRNMVLQSFIQSNEFFSICESYGITAVDEHPDIVGFTRGTGTQENPYVITKPEQFELIESNIDKVNQNTYFVLGKDISLQGIVFTPIGAKTPFSGQFDGKGYTLNNLTVNGSGSYGAMFVRTSETASISNVNLVKVSIINLNNNYYTAGLVGENNGQVSNCHVQGVVKATNNYLGGLIAYNKGRIYNSSFEGTCIGDSTLGGLVGGNTGTIDDCYSKGTNTGKSTIGGLIGDNYGTVTNSYSVSESTTSNSFAGGLIGYDSKGKVYNSFSMGSVNGYHQYRGGLVGESEYGYFENCYSATKLNDVHWNYSYNGLLIGYSKNATLNTCYGNSDSRTSWGNYEGDKVDCKLFTTQQMKTSNFVQLLNSNVASSYWKNWTRNDNVNEGLPYFVD